MLAKAGRFAGSEPAEHHDVRRADRQPCQRLMENAANIVSDRLGEDIHNTLVVTQRR